MTMTYQTREALRHDLIIEQANKSEAGLSMILDGTAVAELHLFNAISIVTDSAQAFALLKSYMRIRQMRLQVWSILGTLNSDRIRG